MIVFIKLIFIVVKYVFVILFDLLNFLTMNLIKYIFCRHDWKYSIADENGLSKSKYCKKCKKVMGRNGKGRWIRL